MYHRPLWMQTTPRIGVEPFARLTFKAFNRSNAALTVGGLYQFDMGFTLGATTEPANSKGQILGPVANYNWGEPNSAWSALIVQPAAAATNNSIATSMMALALTAAGDNEESEVLVMGVGTVLQVNALAAVVYERWCQIESVPGTTQAQVRANGAATPKQIGWNLDSIPNPVVANVRCLFSGLGMCR